MISKGVFTLLPPWNLPGLWVKTTSETLKGMPAFEEICILQKAYSVRQK